MKLNEDQGNAEMTKEIKNDPESWWSGIETHKLLYAHLATSKFYSADEKRRMHLIVRDGKVRGVELSPVQAARYDRARWVEIKADPFTRREPTLKPLAEHTQSTNKPQSLHATARTTLVENLNLASVDKALELFQDFDAEEAEKFFAELGNHYSHGSEYEADNRYFSKISELLDEITTIIKNRKGN